MIDFVCKILIPILCAILTMYIIPLLKEKKLYGYVTIAVQAAEQIFKQSGLGEQKFDYVKQWITEKFRIREEDLEKIIESAVYELNKNKTGLKEM